MQKTVVPLGGKGTLASETNISLLTLITFSLANVWMSLGEN